MSSSSASSSTSLPPPCELCKSKGVPALYCADCSNTICVDCAKRLRREFCTLQGAFGKTLVDAMQHAISLDSLPDSLPADAAAYLVQHRGHTLLTDLLVDTTDAPMAPKPADGGLAGAPVEELTEREREFLEKKLKLEDAAIPRRKYILPQVCSKCGGSSISTCGCNKYNHTPRRFSTRELLDYKQRLLREQLEDVERRQEALELERKTYEERKRRLDEEAAAIKRGELSIPRSPPSYAPERGSPPSYRILPYPERDRGYVPLYGEISEGWHSLPRPVVRRTSTMSGVEPHAGPTVDAVATAPELEGNFF